MMKQFQVFMRSRIISVVGLVALSTLSGCGPEEVETNESAGESISSPSCSLESLSLQPRARFRTGETFYLPAKLSGEGCPELSWSLEQAPAANANALVKGADGYFRFSPHVSGTYSFKAQRADTGEVLTDEFVALPGEERPFHNVNYYPSNSMAEVGSELWVADVYSPTISRLGRDSMAPLGSVTVGNWPVSLAYVESRNLVVVANAASDTLGLVDVATLRQVDAIWVGDEPTNVIISPDGAMAYVALSGHGALAVVDLETRQLVTQIETVFDPKALAMKPDGSTIYVASNRSGQSSQYPYEDRDPATELDIAIVDTASMSVSGYILEVAATINDLLYHEGKDELWVSATSNSTDGLLNDPNVYNFRHEVFALVPEAGAANRTRSADLTRQDSSGGHAVVIHGMDLCGETLYVTAEGSDLAIALDPYSFAEIARYATPGRPRAILCADSGVKVHTAPTMAVHTIDNGQVSVVNTGAPDLRPDDFVAGYTAFTEPGDTVAANRSCSTCHVDGHSDGLVWNAGPFNNYQVTRPFRWLEGTGRIGWDGYVGSIKISGYVGGSTTNTRPDTETALTLGNFLASLMPAPQANAKTHRDGAFSEEALVGKAIFEGKAACGACHGGPKTTNQAVYENGMTPGVSDVPTLVDVAKVGSWLKDGSAASLQEALDAALHVTNISLTDDEAKSVVRYLEEITDRELFVLNANFQEQVKMAVDQPIKLTFNQPILADAINLAKIMVEKPGGGLLSVSAQVNNRHVTLRPNPSLEPGTTYKVIVGRGFQADNGRMPTAEIELEFETAELPEVSLDGEYQWIVSVPMIDFDNGGFSDSITVDAVVPVNVQQTEGGGIAIFDLGQDLEFTTEVVVDGTTLHITDLPVPAGPSFGNGSRLEAGLFDADNDGVADGASGTLALSGPAFDVPGVRWRIQRIPSAPTGGGDGCTDLAEGAHTISINRDGDLPVISWDGPNALGVYVTDPAASLPAGPGQTVSGGDAYWVLEMKSFPAGFGGPVTYGQATSDSTDASELHGAPVGGAELVEGNCYKFSVTTNDFQSSSYTLKW